jgi:hypothetical protein
MCIYKNTTNLPYSKEVLSPNTLKGSSRSNKCFYNYPLLPPLTFELKNLFTFDI